MNEDTVVQLNALQSICQSAGSFLGPERACKAIYGTLTVMFLPHVLACFWCVGTVCACDFQTQLLVGTEASEEEFILTSDALQLVGTLSDNIKQPIGRILFDCLYAAKKATGTVRAHASCVQFGQLLHIKRTNLPFDRLGCDILAGSHR